MKKLDKTHTKSGDAYYYVIPVNKNYGFEHLSFYVTPSGFASREDEAFLQSLHPFGVSFPENMNNNLKLQPVDEWSLFDGMSNPEGV